MALYSRKYGVPAGNRLPVTNRLLEALAFHEKDFHVKVTIREPAAKPGQGKPAGWLTLIMRQLTGK
jgi:hypothetical protein